MSRTYTCEKKCCYIEIANYTSNYIFRPNGRKKAGVFIFDPEEKKVLLVQSRASLWGPPKGSVEIEKGETSYECAIREVREETGLVLTAEDFSRATRIKNRALYYYAEKKAVPVTIQSGTSDVTDGGVNDANGITWIKLDCLEDCVRDGKIFLNQHCKILFKKFLGLTFPKTDFIKVIPRRKRKRRKEED